MPWGHSTGFHDRTFGFGGILFRGVLLSHGRCISIRFGFSDTYSDIVPSLVAMRIQGATCGYAKSKAICKVNLVKIDTVIRLLDVAV